MPVYNGETTLEKTLQSLLSQEKDFFELIIVNDASADNSLEILRKYANRKENWILINNDKNLGLAKSYNKGICKAKGNLIVTMHQDIVLAADALKKLIAPFMDNEVVATGHADIHPPELWKKYNFWQKCFFARFQNLNTPGINGQFDCFRKSALEKVGLFDEIHFRTAGEDGDLVDKLKKIGKVANSQAKTIHIHKIDPNFSWKDIVRKHKQYAEARGTLLALGRIRELQNIIKNFFREMMVFSLFIPYLNIIALASIITYSFIYTGPVYLREYKNPKIIWLPFFNVYLLFVSFIYSLKGFVFKQQKI